MLLTVLIASCGGGTTTTSAGGATTTAAGVTTTAGGAATTAAGVTTTAAPVSSTQYTILVGAPIQIPFYEAYVAVSQGFFEKRGLKVKVVAVDGADGQITGLASGVGNIMYDAVSTFLVPNAKEFNPIAFYMEETNGLWDLVVPASSPIQKMEELDGKVIGVTSPQDPGVNLVLNMNRVLGIKATTLIVTDAMQAMAAFNRGDIAAFSGVVVDIAVMQAQGVAMRSIATTEIRAISGGMGYWSPKKIMDANPQDFRAIVAALQEAEAYINYDPQKLVDWANSQEPIAAEDMGFSLELAKQMIALRSKEIKPVGYIVPEMFQQWWDGFLVNNIIDSSAGKPTDYYTNQFFAK
jgi:NitT/TauT family transport system substrate-binding protein